MADTKTKGARLLPKELWSQCSECEREVPEFEFAGAFQDKVNELKNRGDRIGIIKALRSASGCDLPVAKGWVAHKTYTIIPKPKTLLSGLRSAAANG
jgi:hypothetical protein